MPDKNPTAKSDLVGQVFTRLTVLEYAGQDRHGNKLWRCQCICGNYTIPRGSALRSGKAVSCGCYRRERVIEANFEDLTGKRFGNLTALELVGRTRWRASEWLCICDCGTSKIFSARILKTGDAVSCGCLHAQIASVFSSIKATTHGASDTPTYQSWCNMIQRCTNPANTAYERYGGRGIRICKRWTVFENFLADMGFCPEGLTIERKDNEGNYSCGKCEECIANAWRMNCKWATYKEQANNRRPRRKQVPAPVKE